jgi:hypothetical protein
VTYDDDDDDDDGDEILDLAIIFPGSFSLAQYRVILALIQFIQCI